MKGKGTSRFLSLGRLLERAEIPRRSVGLFWLGGHSLAFKSSASCVYVIDPAFPDEEHSGPVGAIDVRPDLVLCSLKAPAQLDLSTLSHLASAYPQAQFVAGGETRDWMIGRKWLDVPDDVPVNPSRVHTLDPDRVLDVRNLALRDQVKVRVLSGADAVPDGPWNLLFHFEGIQVCLMRDTSDLEQVEKARELIRHRVDVLFWPLDGGDVEEHRKGVALFEPRYVIPIGYDRIADGRSRVRAFRDAVSDVPGAKVYMFPDDYMEGLVYSRIMSRRRR
ncbi:MAG: MBL fold metallo-hydrolase [bacterium]|nr:MBL fold metallo-hydrolase [bacterium]